jgi:hypothetical protein
MNNVGWIILAAQTLPDFFSGLKQEGYNSVNPNYWKTLKNSNNNIPKWEATCGVN